jgi:hypothetical protein
MKNILEIFLSVEYETKFLEPILFYLNGLKKLTLVSTETKVPRMHQSLSEGFSLSTVYRKLV